MKKEASKKIFITGVGRSGTTLIQSMLNAHTALLVLPETQFFKKFIVPEIKKEKSASGNNLNAIRKEVLNDPKLQRYAVSLEDIFSRIPKKKGEVFQTLYLEIIRELKENKQKHATVDKDPLFLNFIPELHKAFPDSFLLQIFRDPRDVILSRQKSDWGKKTSFWIHLFETKYGMGYCSNLAKKTYRNKYISFKYEDLLATPGQTLHEICRNLEIHFQPQMLEYHKYSKAIVAKEERWKDNVKKPLIKNNSRKWQSSMSRNRIKYIELLLSNEMKAHDYSFSSSFSVVDKLILNPLLIVVYFFFQTIKNIKKGWPASF